MTYDNFLIYRGEEYDHIEHMVDEDPLALRDWARSLENVIRRAYADGFGPGAWEENPVVQAVVS